jgi:hypothetical protein
LEVKSHKPQNCPEHKAVGYLLMFGNIKGFDWSHTDEFRNNSCWPEDSSNPGSSLIHSDQWMSGTISDAFAERLENVLTNCQPYPGDSESKTNISVSCFLVLVPEKDLFTIHDNKRGMNSYLHLLRVRLSQFSVEKWYAKQCARQLQDPY